MLDVKGPKILLTDTNRWPVTPRLAIAFSRAGCEVAVLCPVPGHPVVKTGVLKRVFTYNGFRPIQSLHGAIEQFRPDIIVPACDRGVQHLHELHATMRSSGGDPLGIAALIERSLGAAESFPIVSSRLDLLEIAKTEGIPVPAMLNNMDFAGLENGNGHYAVIKADGTWGGRGVRLAQSAQDAMRSMQELALPAGYLELVKRMLLNRDRGWVFFDWKHSSRPVIAQRFIEGRPANCAVACWNGELLAGIAVEVVLAHGARGPAIVVQIVEGAAMIDAAAKLARRLKLSGFFGLDFMIAEGSGETYLIEMNPRCTPPCPLPLGEGRDLVAAMVAQLTGNAIETRERVTAKNRIAYFPQGSRVSNNEITNGCTTAYLDVPVGEQELIHELMNPWPERSILGRLVDQGRKLWKKEPDVPACEFLRPVATVDSDRPAAVPF